LEERRQRLLSLTRLLVKRLERLSVDSLWARRVSGARGSLLRQFDRVESETWDSADLDHLEVLTLASFKLLERAAKAIGEPLDFDMGSRDES
jgi:hypothetical protein